MVRNGTLELTPQAFKADFHHLWSENSPAPRPLLGASLSPLPHSPRLFERRRLIRGIIAELIPSYLAEGFSEEEITHELTILLADLA